MYHDDPCDTEADRACGWPAQLWGNTPMPPEYDCNEDAREATPVSVIYSKSSLAILGFLAEHGESDAPAIRAGLDIPGPTVMGQLRRMRDAMTIRFRVRTCKSRSYYVYLPD
jgi:hypothetical protein